MAQHPQDGKESACHAGDLVPYLVGKMPWRRAWLPAPVLLGFPGGSGGKESACNAGDLGSEVRFLGWKVPLQKGMASHSSILVWKIDVDRGAWRATVHGVGKSRTRLSDLAQHTSLQSRQDVGWWLVDLWWSVCFAFMRSLFQSLAPPSSWGFPGGASGKEPSVRTG